MQIDNNEQFAKEADIELTESVENQAEIKPEAQVEVSTEGKKPTKKSKNKNTGKKIRLATIVALEIVAVAIIIALIFFSDKKVHTVKFDLDGGMLISGDLEQRVPTGLGAIAPQVARYGYYLIGWSEEFDVVTQDMTIKAIWEYETTSGIEYSVPHNTNYCTISGSFKEIQGDVFIGSYYNDRQVLAIGAGAFKDRTGVKAVYMLDGILTIESEAFSGCTSLEAIEIPSTVVRIGENAFKGCTSLKVIVLPTSLESIDPSAFSGCTSLESIVFSDSVKTIGGSAFADCTSLKEITIPSSVETIGASAFSGCTALNSVTLGDGLVTIGRSAFKGCVSLDYIYIPGRVRGIGKSAFDTPEMTIELYIKEDHIPKKFFIGWHAEDATVTYGVGDRNQEIEDYIAEKEEEEKNEKPLFDFVIKDPTIIRPGLGLDTEDGDNKNSSDILENLPSDEDLKVDIEDLLDPDFGGFEDFEGGKGEIGGFISRLPDSDDTDNTNEGENQ